MARIMIAMPCFGGVSPKVYHDHFRFAFYLGRRCPEHDFFMAVKPKTEQFRARNNFVEQALQLEMDYLWMLDDDMIFDIDDISGVSDRYDVIPNFLKALSEEPKAKVVGVLYYQRGGDCLPVLMRKNSRGGFTFLKDHEIEGKVQEVDVAGGGSLFIDMEVFDHISPPYFGPEYEWGTDIQLCQKVKDAGFKVLADTSVELGHEEDNSVVVTSRNRHMVYAQTQEEGIMSEKARNWYIQGPLQDYLLDGIDYLGEPAEVILKKAAEYNEKVFPKFVPREDCYNDTDYESRLYAYYQAVGSMQVRRQIGYHYANDHAKELMEMTFRMLMGRGGRVLDYACGSAPVGFELARHGSEVHFVDIEGAGGLEFLKWRLERHRVNGYCYDSGAYNSLVEKPQVGAVLLMDAIEHFPSWKAVIDVVDESLMNQGAIVTNYFVLGDDPTNVEHISMDREAVQEYLVSKNIYPLNLYVWVKNPVLKEGK